MTEIFIPSLYVLAGFCGFMALHHAIVAAGESWDRTHLLFAVFTFAILLRIGAEIGAYHSDSAQMLVEMRRWQVTFAMLVICSLHWFVAQYTGVRPRLILLIITAFFASGVVVNLLLPYGTALAEVPQLKYLTLPWGEQILDTRSYQGSALNSVYWFGIIISFAYPAYACARIYRHARRRATILGIALFVYLASIISNLFVVTGLIEFVGIAEFGFVGLIGVMSYELLHQRHEEKKRIEAILDHIPAAVHMKNLDGQYVLSNEQNDRLLRTGNKSALGKTDYDFLPPAQADNFRAADKLLIANRVPVETEIEIEQDGERRMYDLLRFPLFDDNGLPYAVTGIASDKTDLRNAQHESDSLRSKVIHDDRLARVGLLVSSLAHELAQPLTAILSNAQAGVRILDHENPDMHELREIAQDIVRDDKRAADLIRNLRTMLRKKESPREQVDLGNCISEAISLLQTEFRIRGIDVSFANLNRHAVLINKSQIQQVIINVLMNAAQAMNDLPEVDRQIRISLSRDDDRCVVSVRDCGLGIAVEQLEKVFDTFYTTNSDGLGMGLAVCRSIITSHGGTIWAEADDKPGANILFALPI